MESRDKWKVDEIEKASETRDKVEFENCDDQLHVEARMHFLARICWSYDETAAKLQV
jgi:hypothetical protein